MPELLQIFAPAASEILLMLGSVCLFFVPAPRAFACALLVGALILVCEDTNIGLNMFEDHLDPTMRVTTFSGMFIVDCFAKIQKIVICVWTYIYILTLKKSYSISPTELFFVLLTVIGGMLALSANDFTLLFFGCEFVSLGSIILFKDKSIIEKVFIAFGVGSALFLFGVAIFYGMFNTTNFSLLSSKLMVSKISIETHPFAFFAISLIILGFFAKTLYWPFHGLNTEAAEKTELPTFTFWNFLQNLLTFSVLIRLFILFNCSAIRNIFLFTGMIGMILGFFSALRQNQIKNILASHSVGTMGMLQVGFATSYTNVISSSFFLLAVYGLSLLVFIGSILFIQERGSKILTVNNLSLVQSYSPVGAFVLGFGALSLVSLLPFPGFVPFFTFVQNFVEESAYVLLTVVVALKLASMIVGIKIVRALLFVGERTAHVPTFPAISACLCGILTICEIYADKFINVFMLAEATMKYYCGL
jgi:NADH:ubiquinone oxidoreductase subunit 2 (subunit N)